MIVSKFGESITANAEGVKKALEIIKSNPERRYVIASAPGSTSNGAGITDMLYMFYSSFFGKENYNDVLKKISDHYKQIIDGLGMNFDLDFEISEVKKSLLSGKSSDFIASRGEYIMGKILAEFLGWDFIDASEIIFFNHDGTLDREKTFSTANEKILKYKNAIIPGFYGSMPDGDVKTFSRGDGDSSGAIIACAVKADLFEKWSNKTKVFSADSAVIPNPKKIKHLTYMEAVEVNYTGNKIIKDSVIFMLKEADIPLKIFSINESEDEGMLISSKIPENVSRNIAVCISGRKGFNVIHIKKYGLNKMFGFGEKLFGLFAKYRIPCEHCLSGIHNMAVVVKTPMFDLKRSELIRDIKQAIEPEAITVENSLSIIAIIGNDIGPVKGTFAKIFAALYKADITARMIDQGSDDLNIIVGVTDDDYDNAIKALHEAII